MKFQLVWQSHSLSDDGPDKSKKPPIEKAYSETTLVTFRIERQYDIHKIPKAILEDGKPKLIYEQEKIERERIQTSYRWISWKDWLRTGINHRKDEVAWLKEEEQTTWYIDIETLPELVSLFNGSVYGVDFDYEIPILYWR